MPEALTERTFSKQGPADRLRGEAALLRAARHPGVVELVELSEHPEPTLVTRRVDGPSLVDGPVLSVDDVASLVAALAATVADLHQLGVEHGSIRADHVLIAPGGRPVLCGFADGRRVDDPLSCAGDIAGLGEVLRWLLARVPTAQSPPRLRKADSVPTLLSIALQATNPNPKLRPSAQAFAASVRSVASRATRPSRTVRRASDRTARRRGAGLRAAVVAVAVSVTVLIVGNLSGTGTPSDSPSPSTVRSRTSTPSPSVCAAVRIPLQADVDGDGCPEPLRFADGILDAGHLRWLIAGAVDDVVTGDWNCDGRATLAFLDRRTGAIYRSDSWPNADVVTVPLVAQVEGAFELHVTQRDASACDLLTVRRAGGGPATPVT